MGGVEVSRAVYPGTTAHAASAREDWREQQAIELLTPFLRGGAPTEAVEQRLMEDRKKAVFVEN